jgi:hypothetical protein
MKLPLSPIVRAPDRRTLFFVRPGATRKREPARAGYAGSASWRNGSTAKRHASGWS